MKPFFPVSSSDMHLTVALGDAILISSGVLQGKTDETELVFLRVRKVDVNGRAVKSK